MFGRFRDSLSTPGYCRRRALDAVLRREETLVPRFWIALTIAGLAVVACGGGSGSVAPTVVVGDASSEAPSAPPSASPSAATVGGQPATELAIATIETVESPSELAEGLDRIWISSYAANEVLPIDPATNEVMATLAVPEGPCGIAAAAGSIWLLDLHGPRIVDNLNGSTIWRLDPARLET
jgi:hypothetical protein